MARTAMDQQIEEGVEQAAVMIGRFLSGAPLSDGPRSPGALARWQHVLLRLFVLAWGGWAGWTWWGLHLHSRVIVASSVIAAALVPVVGVAHLLGRGRRAHMRTLVVPLSLALKDLMPAWDDAQRLKAVTIPVNRSYVKIALPDSWNGQEGHEKMLRELVAARLGGKWEGQWNLSKYPFNVTFVPAKPKQVHEVPDKVDFFSPEMQAAIAACRPGQIVIGLDERSQPVMKEMTGETPMWALSVGSGGGKSSFLQQVITQLVYQGATVVGVDVKMASIICFEGVRGIHLYTDPGNVGDMRAAITWVAQEVAARNYLKKQDPTKEFDRLTLILEEGNEFGDASKAWWNENKEKGEPAADPMWTDIASIMRMGRHVNVTIIGVFQDLREAAVGNRGLRNMFRLIMMGNFNANQWKMIVNTSPIPESVDKAGRMLIIEGNRRVWVQVPFAEPAAFRDYCVKLRRERGYSTADLYGAPPVRSPQRLPSLLQGSRPIGPRTSLTKEPETSAATAVAHRDVPALPQSPSRHPAGEAGQSTDAGNAAPRDLPPGIADQAPADWDPEDGAPRDETPAVEDPADAETEQAPQEQQGPELLSLMQISRRMAQDEGIDIAPSTMRSHKQRRVDFPRGDIEAGREVYSYEAIAEYYRRNPLQKP
ncbi:hypothetical protein [Streptacidiphilus sp. EB103A]|uniref:hypothetical protein n=1 Tax=Streptacidiphilus sp. EB103A TaxID=3156275 RepID=UPI003516980E